ncbi:MAG: DNA mismatch repair protein MutS [Planctomycetaceae bacterium]|jgi:DNA mismatch repair protein MutS|nr:DNA mismatch repair protein MutS [Planctomycetaceae bacterium]
MKEPNKELTPMLRQYFEAKKAYPEALLLFRMGDFYELFFEDAILASQVLNLAVTSRDKGPDATPMAGFPHHQLETYVGKLIGAGYKAAVCDQTEDPKKATGLVRREVTRVVTAGTLTEETLLNPKESNYLAAITDTEPAGLAWVDLSTGCFYASTIAKSQIPDQLARISPSECLVPESSQELVPSWMLEKKMLSRRPDWVFGKTTAVKTLLNHFETSTMEGFGFTRGQHDTPALSAAGAILEYLRETQKQSLEHIDSLVPYHTGNQLEIDLASRRSLEVTRTMRDGFRRGSLLDVLDKCVTSMGGRLLEDWVANPLTNLEEIHARLAAVEELFTKDAVTQKIRESLKKIADLERLLSKIVTHRANPRDLSNLGRSLNSFPEFHEILAHTECELLSVIRQNIDPCEEMTALLNDALIENCPHNSREGDFIRDGFSGELDKLREINRGGKEWIVQYQQGEIERTGITTLKVGFTRVFGYYIEITNTHKEKPVPAYYTRKQTLKNAERYITPELKEYEEKVLTAEERACDLEYEIFQHLCDQIIKIRTNIHRAASALARLDVFCSLATLARNRNYCKPSVVAEPILNIVDGRHPVLDIVKTDGSLVPNDACVDENSGLIQLVTGPNMSGKSTFIRQLALLNIMAQIGSFVPARSAIIGVADRIFARVGASDEIARGYSTFMVEMTETARILNMATRQSLVILDEIGRGTSTYDGISLAWAIVEYLHDKIGCRTFFATHYHELTDLANSMDRITNLNVAVREYNDEIVFLHKIVPGAADKSYGIHVAKLAGVPKEVIQRADEILNNLEKNSADAENPEEKERLEKHRKSPHFVKQDRVAGMQLSLFGPEDHPILDDLKAMDLETVTSEQANNLLHEWKKRLV